MAKEKPKSILICGGTSRAGFDVASFFAAGGRHCIAAGRRPPEINGAPCEHANLCYEQVDFSLPSSVAVFCGRLKNYDINTCVFFQRSRSEDVLEGVQVAVVSSANVSETIAANLASNKGAIIFIGSILGTKADPGQTLSYHVSKGGLHPLVRYLAVKYGSLGIRVNLVSLSTLEHSLNSEGYADGTVLDKIVTNLIPAGRPVRVKDLIDTICFLSDPNGPAITGQELHLDAGLNVLSQVACAMRFVTP